MHLCLRKTLFFILMISIFQTIHSQSIKGRLTDSKNIPVPYAAVYDETTYLSTTSNADGYYELKTGKGSHSLVYKSMGYHIERRQVNISDQNIVLDIIFREQSIELKAVVITPSKEDPAYNIMRKVIGMAPYYLNLVEEYKAEVYLKGTVQVIKIPKLIAKRIEIDGEKNVIKTGDIYLDESLSEITFHAPNKYSQKVIAFHNTYPFEISEAVSPADIIKSSLYAPKILELIIC